MEENDRHRRSSSGSSSSTSSSSSRMCSRIKASSLAGIWYCVLVICFEAYLIIGSVKRFLALASLNWHEQPFIELNTYVGLVGVAVVLAPFFIVSAISKVGNLANDGEKLGSDLAKHSLGFTIGSRGDKGGSGGFVRAVWRHGPPTAPFLHVASAFCLLLPRLLLQARLIQQQLLGTDAIWKTDLDFILPKRDQLFLLRFLLPENASSSEFNLILGNDPSSNGLPGTTTAVTPALLRLSDLWNTNWGSLSPEFINFAFALGVYSVSYSAVFWKTSRWFSGIMSFISMAGSVMLLVAHAGYSVLYKIELLDGNILARRDDQPFLLTSGGVVSLYAALVFTVITCPAVVYLYGYQKLGAFLCKENSKTHVLAGTDRPTKPDCTYVYICALVFMVFELAWIGPLVFDSFLVYRASLDCSVLAASMASVGHFFLWILTWLVLLAIPRWNFTVRLVVAKARLSTPTAVRMVAEVEHSSASGTQGPLVVIAGGKAYPVQDIATQKAIMSAIQRALGATANRAANGVNGRAMAPNGGNLQSPSEMPTSSLVADGSGVASPRRAHTLPARSPRQLAVGKKYGDDRGLPGARQEYGDGEYRPDQPLLGMHQHGDMQMHNMGHGDGGNGRLSLLGPCAALGGRHPGEGQEADQQDVRYATHVANNPQSVTAATGFPSTASSRVSSGSMHGLVAGSFLSVPTNPCGLAATNRSQDSGIPEEGTDSGTSLSPPGLLKPCPMASNTSEAGSSGIHSDGSSSTGGDHQHAIYASKRAISVEQLMSGQPGSPVGNHGVNQHHMQQQQWKSSSLQRGCDQQQTALIVANQQQIIAEHSAGGHAIRDPIYVTHQETIAIRRTQPSGSSPPAQYRDDENPYMRSTNIRLTSFTEGQAMSNGDQQHLYQKQNSHEPGRQSLPLDTTDGMGNDLGHSPTPSPPLPPPPPPVLSQELPEAMAAYRQATNQAFQHQQQLAARAAAESPYGHLQRLGGDGAHSSHSPTYVSRATIYPPTVIPTSSAASGGLVTTATVSSSHHSASNIHAEMLAGTRPSDIMESPYVTRAPASQQQRQQPSGKSVTYNLPPKEMTYESVYGRTPVTSNSSAIRQVRPSGPYSSVPSSQPDHRTGGSHPHGGLPGSGTYMGQNFNGPLRPALKSQQHVRFQ